jgi:hypothetical protein
MDICLLQLLCVVKPITRPEESYQLGCLFVGDQ